MKNSALFKNIDKNSEILKIFLFCTFSQFPKKFNNCYDMGILDENTQF